ncbi:MAG: enoyl-CoA hydratase-related protein [Rubrivivax sp.]|nr:enoyl-CoA hydratase-related protein [Rubrivivax sp.]
MSLDIRTVRVPARLDGEAIAALRRAIGAVVVAGGADRDCAAWHPANLLCGGSTSVAFATSTMPPCARGSASTRTCCSRSPIRRLPVIAMVEGETFGGGVGIAAAADLVLATPDARFGLPEALHGFYPAIVFAALDLRLAPQRSRRLALQCESIDAAAGAHTRARWTRSPPPTRSTCPCSGGARRLARVHARCAAAIRCRMSRTARGSGRARGGGSSDAARARATARALSRPEVRAAIAEALA